MGKNKIKKYGIALSSFFVMFLLTSTAVAMPLMQEKTITGGQYNEGLKNQITNMVKNTGNHKLGMEDLKSISLMIANDPVFRQNATEIKAQIMDQINMLPLECRQQVMDYLGVDEAFDFNKMIERINSMDYGNIRMDIQKKCLKASDNYEQFSNTYHGYAEKLRDIIYRWEPPEYLILSPVLDFLLLILYAIIWLHYGWILSQFGQTGCDLANLITLILFCPIIVPMCFYASFLELWQLDPNYRSEVTFINFIPLTLGYMFFTDPPAIDYGINYILFWLMLEDVEQTPDGYTIVTGESSPTGTSWISIDPVSKWVTFMVDVEDSDILQFNHGGKSPRDYIQVGWDWDGDLDPDEWTTLRKQVTMPTEFVANRIYDTGSHTVYAFLRDNFGVRSIPIKFDFTVNNDMSLVVNSMSSSTNVGLSQYINQEMSQIYRMLYIIVR